MLGALAAFKQSDHILHFCGRSLTVESAEPPFYSVEISMGFGEAGDGGLIRVKRDGDTFTVVEVLREWNY